MNGVAQQPHTGMTVLSNMVFSELFPPVHWWAAGGTSTIDIELRTLDKFDDLVAKTTWLAFPKIGIAFNLSRSSRIVINMEGMLTIREPTHGIDLIQSPIFRSGSVQGGHGGNPR